MGRVWLGGTPCGFAGRVKDWEEGAGAGAWVALSTWKRTGKRVSGGGWEVGWVIREIALFAHFYDQIY